MKLTFHLLIEELNKRIGQYYYKGKDIKSIKYFLMSKIDKTGLMQIISKIPGSPSFMELANMKKEDMVNLIIREIKIREYFSIMFNYRDGISLKLGEIRLGIAEKEGIV